MDTSTCAHMSVFADWLDVTFPPDEDVWSELSDLLSSSGALLSVFPNGTRDYRFPEVGYNNAQFTERDGSWQRISFSGGFLQHLRSINAFSDVLFVLGSHPHKITRLDVTADFPVDGADIVSSLRSRYSGGLMVKLTRKGSGTTSMLSSRPSDDRETGTFYVGHKSRARVSARVYDKAYEVLKRTGKEIPALTRYEVTIRSGVGVTLRDVAQPGPVFWHFASPGLLQAPSDVSEWSPNRDDVWSGSKPSLSDYERLERRVSGSAELDALMDLADKCGDGGRLDLLRMLRSRLGLTGVSIPALGRAA